MPSLDSFGNPHIAWYDDSGGDGEIYYRYWSASVCQCPAGPKGCISGTVTKIGTGAPLAGRQVILSWDRGFGAIVIRREVTDVNGCYMFDNLPSGRYDVFVGGRCRAIGGGRHQFVKIRRSGKVNDVNFECQ